MDHAYLLGLSALSGACALWCALLLDVLRRQ